MNFIDTGFKGLFLIEIDSVKDERGAFGRTFCKREFSRAGFTGEFVQMNYSFNARKGTLRGMHYQVPPHEETKLIRCVTGKAFDVAVDLRSQSPTYLKWFGCELSGENRKMILIPGGFAHGFITLEEKTELIYCHTEFYNPAAETGIRFDDSAVNIQWPAAVSVISEKDKNYPLLKTKL